MDELSDTYPEDEDYYDPSWIENLLFFVVMVASPFAVVAIAGALGNIFIWIKTLLPH